jgi:hypothetical protein
MSSCNNTKNVFPGLHCCLTSHNSTGMPHSFPYVIGGFGAEYIQSETTEETTKCRRQRECCSVSLYLQQIPRACQRASVLCASVFKISFDDSIAYDAAEAIAQSGALAWLVLGPGNLGRRSLALIPCDLQGSPHDNLNRRRHFCRQRLDAAPLRCGRPFPCLVLCGGLGRSHSRRSGRAGKAGSRIKNPRHGLLQLSGAACCANAANVEIAREFVSTCIALILSFYAKPLTMLRLGFQLLGRS